MSKRIGRETNVQVKTAKPLLKSYDGIKEQITFPSTTRVVSVRLPKATCVYTCHFCKAHIAEKERYVSYSVGKRVEERTRWKLRRYHTGCYKVIQSRKTT